MSRSFTFAASCAAGLALAASLAAQPHPAPAAAPAAPAKPAYHLVREIPLGGEGGWDYLAMDAAARRLYVTRSARVVVLDADSGKVVGEIAGLSGVHGVALAPELGRGFISNGRSSTITVFDLKTLAKLGEIPSTGQNPDAILYDPASKRVFAMNGRSGDATVIDAATSKVAGTVALGGKPEFATTDLQGTVFVNLEDKSQLVAVDAQGLKVKARWPLAPCEEPSGMAIDRARRRLLVGCSNQLAAWVDADGGKVVATVPIGKGVDANAFDQAASLGFSSNGGDGTLTVLGAESADRLVVLGNVPTRRGARTMALDEKTHQIFLATAQFGPPPAPTAEQPHPRPAILPGTFVILVMGR